LESRLDGVVQAFGEFEAHLREDCPERAAWFHEDAQAAFATVFQAVGFPPGGPIGSSPEARMFHERQDDDPSEEGAG
jgi:hypothetical protein